MSGYGQDAFGAEGRDRTGPSASQGANQPNAQTAQPNPSTSTLPLNLNLNLGFLPAASSSQTSLLEAVVGPVPRAPQQQPHSHHSTNTIPARSPSAYPHPAAKDVKARSAASGRASPMGSRDPSGSDGSRSFGTSTEREWDVLSDKSLKLNEGEAEVVVEELQKKVNKRKSNLPHLESELAALEAQIKAAEERIARAQSGSGRA